MTQPTELILRQILQLPANDRAALVDSLIVSLDKPDPSLDDLWLREAESRLTAYRSGEIEAVDAEWVFAEMNIGVLCRS